MSKKLESWKKREREQETTEETRTSARNMLSLLPRVYRLEPVNLSSNFLLLQRLQRQPDETRDHDNVKRGTREQHLALPFFLLALPFACPSPLFVFSCALPFSQGPAVCQLLFSFALRTTSSPSAQLLVPRKRKARQKKRKRSMCNKRVRSGCVPHTLASAATAAVAAAAVALAVDSRTRDKNLILIVRKAKESAGKNLKEDDDVL